MFRKLFRREPIDLSALFSSHFVEAKSFYTVAFNKIPCVSFVGELDITAVFAFIEAHYRSEVIRVYQHNYFNHATQQMHFNNTLFVMSEYRLVELANNYVQVLHTHLQYDWANSFAKQVATFRHVPEAEHEKRVIGFARQNQMN